jgi:hypothetical protein
MNDAAYNKGDDDGEGGGKYFSQIRIDISSKIVTKNGVPVLPEDSG